MGRKEAICLLGGRPRVVTDRAKVAKLRESGKSFGEIATYLPSSCLSGRIASRRMSDFSALVSADSGGPRRDMWYVHHNSAGLCNVPASGLFEGSGARNRYGCQTSQVWLAHQHGAFVRNGCCAGAVAQGLPACPRQPS